MTLIVFKDGNKNPIALSSGSIFKVGYLSENMSNLTYRIGDEISYVEVSHPVLEVVEAINKVTGVWS